jgi:hypothetical protein
LNYKIDRKEKRKKKNEKNVLERFEKKNELMGFR